MLIAHTEQYAERHTQRKVEAFRLHRLYEGISDSDIEGAAEFDETGDVGRSVSKTEPVEITLNIAQDLVDTLVSKVAGRENNKPQIVCTDAKWEVRRQGILADRLIEGIFTQQQGKFYDLWDVFREALRMALGSTRTSAVKIYSDIPAKKVRAELHDTLSMWVDTSGHPYDYPSQLGEVTYWDPEKLCDVFPDDEEAIYAAVKPIRHVGLEALDEDHDYMLRERIERVPVYEGWKLALGGRPGRYCMAIPGKYLKWEPYKHEDPPFIFVGGIRSMTGFWHRTLTKPVAEIILQVNQILNRVKNSENLTPKRVGYFDPEDVTKELMETIDDVIMIPVPGLNSGKGKPVTEAPAPFHPLVLELIQFLIQQAYSLSGVSQMHTAGDVKGEAWSGVALRLKKQLLDERFAPVHRAYMHASCIEAAQHILRCSKEIYAADPSFAVTWKGDGFSKKIDAGVLSVLDDNDFSVDIYAVSESKNTPEDRIQLMKELMETGIVTGDAFNAALRDYDTYAASSVPDEQRQFVAKQIDKWLFAGRKELRAKDFYKGPFITMNLVAALAQVNRGLMAALTDEVDDVRVEFFKRFALDCKNKIEKAAADRAALARQAGGGQAAAMIQAEQTGQQAPMPAQQAA